jgi:hypothetical protein
MAIKTTWTEVNKIIKEEFQRVMEKKKIQSRIQQINEELAHMEEEDSKMMGEDENLEEVEATGLEKLDSETGLVPNVKYGAEFDHSRAPALMEDDEIEVGDDDDDTEEEGSLADEFAELGEKIEARIMAALGKIDNGASETPEEEEEEEEEEFEDVVVSDDEEEVSDEEDTVDEYNEVVPSNEDGGVTTTHSMDDEKESLNESTTKRNGKYLNVLSEGLDSRKKNALSNEIERMRKLARLGNND